MRKSVIDNSEYCFFCGRIATGKHHLIFGNGRREKADIDGIFIPICDGCHTIGEKTTKIHDNEKAEALSKMLGQAIWMLHCLNTKEEIEVSKKEFMKRYGKNYL